MDARKDARPNRPHRTAFMNQKGGVGKTTSTVSLAAALAKAGRQTLLIDLDPQAHATLHLGLDPDGLDASVYDLLLDPSCDALSVVQEARENLMLLPAEVGLAAAETELTTEPDRNQRLKRAVAELEQLADVVLIDCPPSLGLLTLNALALADSVVVPMQAHFLALQGLGKLLETVHLVAAQVNPNLRVLGVVLCMHDENTNLAKEIVADLETFFLAAKGFALPWSDAHILTPGVRRNIKLAEAPSFGQTIFEYAPTSAGAQDYEKLGEDFWRALNAPPPAMPRHRTRLAEPAQALAMDNQAAEFNALAEGAEPPTAGHPPHLVVMPQTPEKASA